MINKLITGKRFSINNSQYLAFLNRNMNIKVNKKIMKYKQF